MRDDLTRRGFLGASATAAAAGLTALNWSRIGGAQPANDKVRVGVVGCGGMGGGHIGHYSNLPDVQIAALCDVDRGRLGAAAERVAKASGQRPRTFGDFRELLDLKDIDAVSVATPDHWHAIVMISACRAGKDVYCEKPIAHDIVEGRAMVDAALKHKRIVQIGTQQRSGAHFQHAIGLVRAGALGRIVETHTWNCENAKGIGRPPDADPPAGVDYDFWLGPAPKRPFNPNRFHWNWHWFYDYGGGMAVAWNVHLLDIIQLALEAWSPRSVSMVGQVANEDDNRDTPDTAVAVYAYDSKQGPFTHTYTLRRTNALSPDGRPEHASHGMLFCGSKGSLFIDRKGWELTPEAGQGEPRKGGGSDQYLTHFRNFIACVKDRAQPTSDIESMHRTSTACHLANVSYKVGRRIYWDAKQEKCFRDADLKAPDDEANARLGRDYRKPWGLPAG